MMGHKICFYEEVLIIIPKLSLLLLLIWSPDVEIEIFPNLYFKVNENTISGAATIVFSFLCPFSTRVNSKKVRFFSPTPEFFSLKVDPIFERLGHPRYEPGNHVSCSP